MCACNLHRHCICRLLFFWTYSCLNDNLHPSQKIYRFPLGNNLIHQSGLTDENCHWFWNVAKTHCQFSRDLQTAAYPALDESILLERQTQNKMMNTRTTLRSFSRSRVGAWFRLYADFYLLRISLTTSDYSFLVGRSVYVPPLKIFLNLGYERDLIQLKKSKFNVMSCHLFFCLWGLRQM